ncbi:MAG: AmmeMemoRadiSam system protein B [candidate division Zixibacteria bacterium]|nr:AmmeMemoRadiSam system protein B [candidate division Zixibacteria bacterium]
MPGNDSDIRKPAVAGLFYPASPGELAKTIAKLYAEVDKTPIDGHPLALIVPHAGYPYSGLVAAEAYKLLEGRRYDTVVILAPSHTVFFKGSSVYDGDGYRTPLGVVETDRDMSRALASIHPSIDLSRRGHATGSTRGEHALEVQLPFLQVVLGAFKLVAVVMGDQETDTVRPLAEALAATLKGTNTLMVASSDLSHFHAEKEARRLDQVVQKAIEQFDPDLLLHTLESGQGEACGGGPMAAVMAAARRLGASTVQTLGYATSGETTADFDSVVGYLSAVIVTSEEPSAKTPVIGSTPAREKAEGFTEEDKAALHKIARDAIRAKLDGVEYAPPQLENLKEKRGAFVTLTSGGRLRGCIGQIMARQPLYEAVAEMAVAAAFEDPRFAAISEEDFERIDIELSVLSPLKRVYELETIKVGRDGLMIKLDMHSGLLLPQVASEYGWSTVEFLQQTCLKAGLPKDSYKNRRAEIYRFSADVF